MIEFYLLQLTGAQSTVARTSTDNQLDEILEKIGHLEKMMKILIQQRHMGGVRPPSEKAVKPEDDPQYFVSAQ